MLVAGKDHLKIDRLKNELSKSFDMDLGLAQHILEMKVSRNKREENYGYYKSNTSSIYYRSSR